MVDMGFAPDLRRILRLLPARRQTLMFSATMPPELNRVASESLTDPQRVDLAPPSRPAAGITQAIYPVPRHLKTDLLDEVLLGPTIESVIVFTRTKHGADRLTRQLKQRGHSVAALHGDRTQSQRERALADLKRGRVQILVATDIASRGLDVDDISHVINYDVPHTPEDYVHRIGRTGRLHAVGDAFTLMSPEEKKDIATIERFLGRAIPRVLIPDFDYHKVGGGGGTGRPHDRERPRGSEGGGRRRRPAGERRGNRDERERTPSSVGRVAQGSAGRNGRSNQRPAGAGEAARTGGSPEHGRRPRRNVPDRRRRRM
jgi:ATP-dependent RNA helicase RhlE